MKKWKFCLKKKKICSSLKTKKLRNTSIFYYTVSKLICEGRLIDAVLVEQVNNYRCNIWNNEGYNIINK